MSERDAVEFRRHRMNLWIETGVVFLVCVAPPVFSGMAANYFGPAAGRATLVRHALGSIVDSAGPIALVLYIIGRSGEPFARFGIRPFRWGRDLLGGVALWVVIELVSKLAIRIWPAVVAWLHIVQWRHRASYPPPSTPGELVLWAIACVGIGASEEIVFRAYLITRFEELFESTTIALLLSTAIFASQHGYQGTFGPVQSAAFALVEGSAFCLFRRFAPLAVAHAIGDFYVVATRKF